MNVIKSPQDKIESYLYNEINIELYEDFSIHFKTEIKLLQFLNNLFIEFEFFSNNVNNWIEITNHFIFLETGYLFWTDEIHFNYKTEPEKLFELFNLYEGLTMLIQFHFPENKRTGAQIKTCEYIIKLGEKIQKLYLPELQKEVPIKTEPETIVINGTSTTVNIKVFDPNHFNNDCHNLFNYLVENYSKKGKVKFINIYYFLKDEVDKQKYSFNFIQDDYTIFIKAKHQIEIKKYQKAEYDFIEQKRILNSHEQQFRKQ